MQDDEATIRATMQTIERAGVFVSWISPRRAGEPHVFTALTRGLERCSASGIDPLETSSRLIRMLGLEGCVGLPPCPHPHEES